jgi:glycosyltransferase involved in cell wall biosynthesis
MALVTSNYLNTADGAASTLHRIVDALRERDVRVAVIAPDAEEPQMEPAPVMLHPPSMPLPLQDYRFPVRLGTHVRSRLRDFDPQLFHVASPDPASLLAMRYARQRGLPLISTFHTNFPAYLEYWGRFASMFSPLAWKALERFYAPCDRVFVPTESMGRELARRGVLEDWSILARGVDRSSFGPRFRSQQWRRKHDIGEDELVVLFCARLVWEKGLRTLATALEQLDASGPAHRVVIVGDGEQSDWLVDNLPYPSIVTGFLNGEELATAFASADVFLYPSTTDTFGQVTLQAMASGLPVIGARAPGTSSLVEDGSSGLLVTPDDPDAFARATAQLLQNDILRHRLSNGARRRALQYSWSSILDEFVREVDALVGRFD